MTDLHQAAKMALAALQKIYIAPEHEEYIRVWWPKCEEAIQALRQALDKPEIDSQALVDMAVLAEREACAKFCETQRNDTPATGKEFAAAIRARSEK